MRTRRLHLLVMTLAALAAGPAIASAQKVTVKSASPPQGEQGTASLEVSIGGSNFQQGASARFLRSGTSDPDGIVVMGTRFVSASEVVATVTIDEGASLSYFDITVENTNGRSGKGTDLFQVVQKNGVGACVVPANPAAYGDVTLVNAGQYSGQFGLVSAVATVKVQGRDRMLMAASTGTQVRILLVTPRAGGTGVDVQELQTITVGPFSSSTLAIPTRAIFANLDNDPGATPDLVIAAQHDARVFVYRASRISTIDPVVYPAGSTLLTAPTGPTKNFGLWVSAGQLDTDANEELIVSQTGSSDSKRRGSWPGAVHVFDHDLAQVATVTPTTSPALVFEDVFPHGSVLADVTGDGLADIVAGSPGRNGGVGEVFVLPGLSTTTWNPVPLVLRPSTSVADLRFGRTIAAADVNGDGQADVIGATNWISDAIGSEVFLGPVTGSTTPASTAYAFAPDSSNEGQGWARNGILVGDIDGDARADVVVGAPHVTRASPCGGLGVLYVFRGNVNGGWQARDLLTPGSYDPDYATYGWSTGFAVAEDDSLAPVRLLVVADYTRDVGGVREAGQISIYRLGVVP